MKIRDRLKKKNMLIGCFLTAALFFWTIDATFDALILRQGAFSDLLLLNVPSSELYSRLLIIAGLAFYGIIISKIRYSTEHKRLKDELRTHEEELSRSETFLNTIFDSIHDHFCIVDRNYRIIRCNEAYMRVKNKQNDDVYMKKCYKILYGRDTICENCISQKTFLSGDPCAGEKAISRPGGSAAWIEIYTYPVLDHNKTVSHVIQYCRDITDRKKTEEENKRLIQKLNCLSTTDGLTGLLNRRALTDVLHHEITRAQRYDGEFALILCDVDKFKGINDTFGHAAGDEALRAVAECLSKSVRKSDILGRYGGDEFLIILPETSLAGAEKLAEKIRTAVSKIVVEQHGNRRITLSLSIGLTGCCMPLDDIDKLMKNVDNALYNSKRHGRNRVSASSM